MSKTTPSLLVFLLALSLPVAAHAALGPDDELIIPGERVGLVTKTTTEDELKNYLGDSYKRVAIPVGEGYCRAGSMIYEGSVNELLLIWRDYDNSMEFPCSDDPDNAEVKEKLRTANFSKPDSVKITIADSAYHTETGIRIGLSVADLEKALGKGFTFSGFGWDYGGRIYYNEMPEYLSGELTYGPLPEKQQTEAFAAAYIPTGDRVFKSRDPRWKVLGLRLGALFVGFPE